tara:strand:- start:49 stop:849 length:801 start_codon:yes stop_codon:yes gene_type:complete
MSNSLKRILVALPAAIIFIWMAWMGGWYFKTMIIGITLLIQFELIRLLDEALNASDSIFSYSIGLLVLLSQELPYAFEIGLLLFLLLVSRQIFSTSSNRILKLSSTLFAGLYVPIGMLSLILIDNFGTKIDSSILTIMLVFMVWGADSLAYFGGKTFGKRSLAPNISPNKTWEGLAFGYLGSIIGMLLVYFVIPFDKPLNLLELLPMAILSATFGPIGDLLESKIKREANTKDSSTLIPGHGGFFDRFDALLLAAPAAYVYLRFIF